MTRRRLMRSSRGWCGSRTICGVTLLWLAMKNEVALKDLLSTTKDGEWGKGEPADGLTEMAVIRGTDFAGVRLGSLHNVPTKYIPEKIAARKRLQPDDILIETAGDQEIDLQGAPYILRIGSSG